MAPTRFSSLFQRILIGKADFSMFSNEKPTLDEDAPKFLHSMGISALLDKTNSVQRLELTVVFF